VELYDYLLWAAPVGLVIGTVELIRRRRVLPLLLGLAAVPLGGVVGRVAWEWFANPPSGFDFGSEFEGWDWVVGFASSEDSSARSRAYGCLQEEPDGTVRHAHAG
jgi:hypothetical protein